MSIPYDLFTGAFLSKVTEYDFLALPDEEREAIVDGYMKRAISAFAPICKVDLIGTADDDEREFNVDETAVDCDELADIISEGMLMNWMKPYLYRQENLENALSTRDFTVFSPAELLKSIRAAYAAVCKHFRGMMNEYSYRHGDLTALHM